MDNEAILAQLNKLGPSQVRTLIAAGQWPDALKPVAFDWLQEKDREAKRLADAVRLDHLDTAKFARDAAQTAASLARESAAEVAAANAYARQAHKSARTANIVAAIAAAFAFVAILLAIIALLAPR
jgi:hypothetical protein